MHPQASAGANLVGSRPPAPKADSSTSAAPAARHRHLANAPRRRRFGIDQLLVDHLSPSEGDVLVDLGCGSGFTLAAAAQTSPNLTLIGLDRDKQALAEAAVLLADLSASFELVCTPLGGRLPLETETVTGTFCHNVLEQLADPGELIAETFRILIPGGRSVWSHPDYDSVVISGADAGLTRQIVHAFADYADATMDHADAQMGRKLPGLIAQGPLTPVTVTSHVLLSTELSGPARFRVESTAGVLRKAAEAGESKLSVDQLESWMSDLEQADRTGQFLYSHVTYIVVAQKSASGGMAAGSRSSNGVGFR